ncbi:hypothetical protein D3C72_1854410 [compost metagenome]
MPILQYGLGVHGRLRNIVGQPTIGRAARLGQAMGQEKLRVGQQPRKPLVLQMLRGEFAQKDRHFPVLHELVGKTGIPTGDLLGDEREGSDFGVVLKIDAAIGLRHAKRANADGLGALQDGPRQPFARAHVPFALPVRADEGGHGVVDEGAAAVAHQSLFLGQ